MFERRGRKEGERDGRLDGKDKFARDPRPRLQLALISNGYWHAYLLAYDQAYKRQQWINERLEDQKQLSKQEAQKVSKEAKTPAELQKSEFERGWGDGYHGREVAPSSPNQIKDSKGADHHYLRGYKIGNRDRDYARAKELRARELWKHKASPTMPHGKKEQNRQDNSGRSL